MMKKTSIGPGGIEIEAALVITHKLDELQSDLVELKLVQRPPLSW